MKATIILFSVIFSLRVITSAILHFAELKVGKVYDNRNNLFELGTTFFWTIYDVLPILLLFRLHKNNFETFDEADDRMLCEMSVDDTASNVSRVMDTEGFNDMMKTNKKRLLSMDSSMIDFSSSSSSSSDSDDFINIPDVSSNSKSTVTVPVQPISTSSKGSKAISLLLKSSLKMGLFPS